MGQWANEQQKGAKILFCFSIAPKSWIINAFFRTTLKFEIGDWRLEIGDWRLEVGDWELGVKG